MIDALARAGLVLGRADYVNAAERAANFVLDELYDARQQTLHRAYTDRLVDIRGYLDDYVFFVRGLISTYSATWNERYIKLAIELTESSIEQFWDEVNGGFYYTRAGEEDLVYRPRDLHDTALPAANSAAVCNLVMLHPFRDDGHFAELARQTLTLDVPGLRENPFGAASLAAAHDCFEHGPAELTVVQGDERNHTTPLNLPSRWLRVLEQSYVPDLLLSTPPRAVIFQGAPVWEGKVSQNGLLTWYVCQNFSCAPPATEPEQVKMSLGG
jgi:hypothetical protein